MVLTVSFVLSPVIGLLSPSLADQGFVRTRSGRQISANLTPAPGRQDHTTSPSAKASLVCALFDRSRAETRPAISTCAQRCRVHRIPHPTSVTIAKRPSVWGGMAMDIEVIWVRREGKYFCKWDWTGQITLIRFNKSRF
jgi:hypothetical protein